MNLERSPYVLAGILFVLAIGVRIPFLPFNLLDSKPLVVTGEFAFDGYYQLSEHIIEGYGFSRKEPYEADSVRTPLYPLFIVSLVKLFGSYKALFVAQILLGALISLLSWKLARCFLGSSPWAYAVGLAVALEPMGAFLTGTILTETLFTSVFICTILLFLHFIQTKNAGTLALFAILLGIASLIKPTLQYVPLLCIIIFFMIEHYRPTTRFFIYSGIVIVLFVATLSPWIYRNMRTFGTSNLVVQPISNMFTYLVPSTIALEQHIPFEQAKSAFFEKTGAKDIDEINLGNQSWYKARAIEELKKHPVGLVKSLGVTVYAFFFNDGYATAFARVIRQDAPLSIHNLTPLLFIVLAGRAFWGMVTFFALWGAWRYFRKKGITPEFIFIVGLIAYFALTSAVIGLAINGRFRIPVDPLLFVLSAIALQDISQKFRKNDISVASTGQ